MKLKTFLSFIEVKIFWYNIVTNISLNYFSFLKRFTRECEEKSKN